MGPIEITWLKLDLEAAQIRRGREWLSPRELARADRYLDPRHGVRYIAAHAQLRWLLSQRMRLAPQAVAFERGPHGKPEVAGIPLRFNLSHSGPWAVVGIHPCLELGVDAESPHRARNWLALADRFFASGEGAALRALPADEVPGQFCRIWTCKEAWMKADGRGLAAGVATAEVRFANDAARLTAPARAGTRAFCGEIPPREGFAAAVVAFVPADRPDPRITISELPPPL